VMSMSVCVSVCLSVRQDISGITCANFTNFSVHVAFGRGSVLEVLYHHTKFGGAQISPAAGASENVEFFSVCLFVCPLHF